ncbi:MAG: hypothetical protein A2015_04225 [Spirochaetes bacterium GWF1_31_7]|nr:MAG: hypothetical protein A2Y30_17045 [Spirochaetes bacterium GWE1_32_154]OHD47422.1 MAG: hypothetical protein A2Y29_10055 [Spirochaetes bacterium GWE2_31_10]OHD53001.1 MAG: hypothetical protein A2015_04225 [Spirochaetes bacterium GWF1_31_7]OHD79846.1 MAG: hypothetical protein A2355_11670 [Spirochaetes bacterium RIFOXYB1_FULL_32_8]
MNRWSVAEHDLKLFLLGVLFLGINNGILTTSFNNYLNDIFHLTASQRGVLEIPREIPGFLLVLITGILASYSMRNWAIAVGLLSAIGVIGLGWFSSSYMVMMIWMVLWSLADHLFMPIENTMGLQLAKDGKHGKRLGQLSGARNFAMISGALIVWIFARFADDSFLYKKLYIIGGLAAIVAAFFFSKLHLHAHTQIKHKRFVIKTRYTLFYIFNILFGARKQIFLTFAPWVLITQYGARPSDMALLIFIASALGVIFRQVFGYVTDRFGEKVMFIADSIILFGICIGFAYVKNIVFLSALYILDNLMFSTRIARTTYLNKIAENKSDVAATISLGISMDHVVSMTIPFLGGLLWNAYGFSTVFIAASLIAVISFIAAFFIRVPNQ